MNYFFQDLSKGLASVLSVLDHCQDPVYSRYLRATENKDESLDQQTSIHYHPSLWFSMERISKKPQIPPSLWEWRVGSCVQHSIFSRGFPRDCLLFCLSQSTNATRPTLDAWGPLRTKTAWTSIQSSTGAPPVARLQAPPAYL